MKIKVLVYPKDTNPYQELLYGHMNESVEITYLKGLTSSQTIDNIFLPCQLLFYRIKGFKIFHLHWVYGFAFPEIIPYSLWFSTIYYYLILIFIKLCGYKIIWTVHNVLPHNKTFINDIAARRFLSKIASAKIIHSTSTIDEMQKYSININNSHIIPIGNYIGVYPNTISRKDARKKLKISDHDFVFLFFGRIEPYKGVEKLLKTFSELKLANSNLIIAGKCTDADLQKKLNKYRYLSNITIIDKYIPDEDIQIYFNAADIVVYPFEMVTTSSAILLALSFGKSIIYPSIGNLKELPDNIGFSYKPNNFN